MSGLTGRKDVGGYCPVLNHWLTTGCQQELESDYKQQPEPRPEKGFCVSGDPSRPALHLPARTSPVRGLIAFLLNLLLSPEIMREQKYSQIISWRSLSMKIGITSDPDPPKQASLRFF